MIPNIPAEKARRLPSKARWSRRYSASSAGDRRSGLVRKDGKRGMERSEGRGPQYPLFISPLLVVPPDAICSRLRSSGTTLMTVPRDRIRGEI